MIKTAPEFNYVILRFDQDVPFVGDDGVEQNLTTLMGIEYDRDTKTLSDLGRMFYAAADDASYNSIHHGNVLLVHRKHDEHGEASVELIRYIVDNDELTGTAANIWAMDGDERVAMIYDMIKSYEEGGNQPNA